MKLATEYGLVFYADNCKRFHHYVYGKEFTIESDHRLLEITVHIASAG